MLNKSSQSTLNGPATTKAIQQCTFVDVEFVCPVWYRVCFSVECNVLCITAIALLFRSCRPPTIDGAIRPIIVDAIERMLQGVGGSHVVVECLKREVPFSANSNATPSVTNKSVVARVVASVAHASPHPVFVAICHPVYSQSFGLLFFVQASATASVPRLQGVMANDLLRPAITAAQPFALPVVVGVGVPQHTQSRKSLPCKVLKPRVRRHRMLLSHVRTSNMNVVRVAGRVIIPVGSRHYTPTTTLLQQGA